MAKADNEETAKRLQEVRLRAEARLAGSEEKVEQDQLSKIGFRVKTV